MYDEGHIKLLGISAAYFLNPIPRIHALNVENDDFSTVTVF